MTDFENETSVIHSFSVIPPLSRAEVNQLARLTEKEIELVLHPGTENGLPVTFLVVLSGDWRLVETALRRLGRDFYEPELIGVNAASSGPGTLRNEH